MRWLRAIFVRQYSSIRSEEWPKALLLSAYFFLLIATHWMLKPVKRGLLIDHFSHDPLHILGFSLGGAEAEQVAKVMNVLGAYLAVILFTWMARRLRRERLVLVFTALFSAIFAAYSQAVDHPGEFTVWSLYMLGDMFNTLMVGLFWAYTNDLTTAGGAKRTYNVIGLGGVLGGFAGASMVSILVREFGRAPLLLLCIVPMAGIALIAVVMRRLDKRPRPVAPPAQPHNISATIEGARLVFQSWYLVSIAGLVASYELVSSVVDFQLAVTVERTISDALAKDAFFATVGQAIGIISVLVQLLLTGFVMQKFGLRAALLFLPVAAALGSFGFLAMPALAFAAAISVSDNALNYSINQSAKEALYTPTSADEKYKAKAFIDMFVQRMAKSGSVVFNLGLSAVAVTAVRWLSLVTLAIVAIWLIMIFAASRGFRRLTERTAKRDGSPVWEEGSEAA
ncbi:MAG: NTP/NDP exchange transporter [Rhodospirillales bacterium]